MQLVRLVPTMGIATGGADPLQCCSQENTVQSNNWCMCRKCYKGHAAKKTHLIAGFQEITILSMLDLNPTPQSSEQSQN